MTGFRAQVSLFCLIGRTMTSQCCQGRGDAVEGIHDDGRQCRLLSHLLLRAIRGEQVVAGVGEQASDGTQPFTSLWSNDQGAVAVVEETVQ